MSISLGAYFSSSRPENPFQVFQKKKCKLIQHFGSPTQDAGGRPKSVVSAEAQDSGQVWTGARAGERNIS